jgi:hypothetical protein
VVERPLFVFNPDVDADFARLGLEAAVGVRTAEDLEARLRDAYPRIRVHVSEVSRPFPVTWYVYREGHWVGPDPV